MPLAAIVTASNSLIRQLVSQYIYRMVYSTCTDPNNLNMLAAAAQCTCHACDTIHRVLLTTLLHNN